METGYYARPFEASDVPAVFAYAANTRAWSVLACGSSVTSGPRVPRARAKAGAGYEEERSDDGDHTGRYEHV